MKKSILNLKGVQQLSKQQQAKINGSNTGMACNSSSDCLVLNSLPWFEHEEFFCFWGYCQIQ